MRGSADSRRRQLARTQPKEGRPMGDLLMLAATVAFFALADLYARACDRL